MFSYSTFLHTPLIPLSRGEYPILHSAESKQPFIPLFIGVASPPVAEETGCVVPLGLHLRHIRFDLVLTVFNGAADFPAVDDSHHYRIAGAFIGHYRLAGRGTGGV